MEATIRLAAANFRTQYNLENPTNCLLVNCHDSIHYFTGLGVSLEDEREILAVTKLITAGETVKNIPIEVSRFIQKTILESRKAVLEALAL